MISITKSQKDYLEQNGCEFGEDLHTTHSHHHHYYATESGKIKTLLKNYERELKSKN